ncbi:hypothetical protein HDU99_002852, partial [Rhizoclosmatium hyalinum]
MNAYLISLVLTAASTVYALPATGVSTAAPFTLLPGPAFDALIVGDWGTDNSDQTAVAAQMNIWAAKTQPSAIINLGDNFYQGQASYEAVQAVNDPKFASYWKNVYNGDSIKSLPWWSVLGNHDWYTVNSQIYELEYQDLNWILPDFFYTKRVQIDTGVYATFLFIETDFLAYNAGGSKNAMDQNFQAMGWSTS